MDDYDEEISFDRKYLDLACLAWFYRHHNYLPNVVQNCHVLLMDNDKKPEKYINHNRTLNLTSSEILDQKNEQNSMRNHAIQLNNYKEISISENKNNYNLNMTERTLIAKQIVTKIIGMTLLICKAGNYEKFKDQIKNLHVSLMSCVVFRHFRTKKVQFIVKTIQNCREMIDVWSHNNHHNENMHKNSIDHFNCNNPSIQRYLVEQIQELTDIFFDADFKKSCQIIHEDLIEIKKINQKHHRSSINQSKLECNLTSATVKYRSRKNNTDISSELHDIEAKDDFEITKRIFKAPKNDSITRRISVFGDQIKGLRHQNDIKSKRPQSSLANDKIQELNKPNYLKDRDCDVFKRLYGLRKKHTS